MSSQPVEELVPPVCLIPYGVSTLLYVLLPDRIGRQPILFALLLAFIVITGLTAAAGPVSQMIH